MNDAKTSIRLVESSDAGVLAAHLARDAETFARWDPEHPPGYYTAAGQRARIQRLLADGQLWRRGPRAQLHRRAVARRNSVGTPP